MKTKCLIVFFLGFGLFENTYAGKEYLPLDEDTVAEIQTFAHRLYRRHHLELKDLKALGESDLPQIETLKQLTQRDHLDKDSIHSLRVLLARDKITNPNQDPGANFLLYYEELGRTFPQDLIKQDVTNANYALQQYREKFGLSAGVNPPEEIETALNTLAQLERNTTHLTARERAILYHIRQAISDIDFAVRDGVRALGAPSQTFWTRGFRGDSIPTNFITLANARGKLSVLGDHLPALLEKANVSEVLKNSIKNVLAYSHSLIVHDINIARIGKLDTSDLRRISSEVLYRTKQFIEGLPVPRPTQLAQTAVESELPAPAPTPNTPLAAAEAAPTSVTAPSAAAPPVATASTPATALERPWYKRPAVVAPIGVGAIALGAATYYGVKHIKKSHDSKAQGAR